MVNPIRTVTGLCSVTHVAVEEKCKNCSLNGTTILFVNLHTDQQTFTTMNVIITVLF